MTAEDWTSPSEQEVRAFFNALDPGDFAKMPPAPSFANRVTETTMHQTTASTTLTHRFVDATAYAIEAHAGHVRKGGDIPYASHLLEVAALVVQFGGSEDQAIAGLLHDVVEDQGGLPRLADVRARFGSDVATMVETLSDSVEEDRATKDPWINRKIHHVEVLTSLALDGDPSVLVAAADKISNARAIAADVASGNDVFEIFKGSRYGTSWYYRTMHDALAAGLPRAARAALEQACRAVVDAAGEDWDDVAGTPDLDRLPATARPPF